MYVYCILDGISKLQIFYIEDKIKVFFETANASFGTHCIVIFLETPHGLYCPDG